MKDYYKILDIEPPSSERQIKRAFRRKAKSSHPDMNQQEQEKDFLVILEAYEILSNPETKYEYDALYRVRVKNRKGFNYREFLRSRQEDKEFQSKLICFDLLHENTDEALLLYEKLQEDEDFRLDNYLDREDFMDFSYLLAEAYVQKKCYVKAYGIFRSIVRYELEKPYFRHFFSDVVEQLRIIGAAPFPGSEGKQAKLRILEELLQFHLSNKDSAYFCKKIAEIHAKDGKNALARQYLKKAMALDEKLPGTKRLRDFYGL